MTNSGNKGNQPRHKRKRKNGIDDGDDEQDSHGYLPTPSQLAAIENGQNVIALKKKKKKKKNPVADSQTSITSSFMPIPKFTVNREIKKLFWVGPPAEVPVSDELKTLRKTHGILASGSLELCPPPVVEIESPFLPVTFNEVFTYLNLKKPSPVQMQCWPCILCGANVLCIAPTGSGKTYAYSLPMMPHILAQNSVSSDTSSIPSPIALVLVPTRELAIQVSTALKPFRKVASIRSLAIYGGQDRELQVQHLTEFGFTQIIIATPGRLLDLVASNKISLSKVSYLVLDEADRMLSLGFEKQLDLIAAQVMPDRQSLLFSATFPGRLREAADRWVGQSVKVRISTVELSNPEPSSASVIAPSSTPPPRQVPSTASEGNLVTQSTTLDDDNGDDDDGAAGDGGEEGDDAEDCKPAIGSERRESSSSLTISTSITQHVHVCAAHKKPRLLMRLIERVRAKEKEEKLRQPGPMLIFCTKIKSVRFLVDFLKKQNIQTEELHGQLTQQQREQRLNNFKAGKLSTLCATDVAARGIHIKRLKYVINYDFPSTLEQYCHRVGRTGRQGEVGETYSLLTRNMAPLVDDLIQLLKSCNQVIEPNLVKLSVDYKNGIIEDDNESNDINE